MFSRLANFLLCACVVAKTYPGPVPGVPAREVEDKPKPAKKAASKNATRPAPQSYGDK